MLMMAKTAGLLVPGGDGGGGYPVFTMTAGQSGFTRGYLVGSYGSISTRDILGTGNPVNNIITEGSNTLYVVWDSSTGATIGALSAALTGMRFYINGTPYTMTSDTDGSTYYSWYRNSYGQFTNGITYTMQIAP